MLKQGYAIPLISAAARSTPSTTVMPPDARKLLGSKAAVRDIPGLMTVHSTSPSRLSSDATVASTLVSSLRPNWVVID
jgi:hypothetical protein